MKDKWNELEVKSAHKQAAHLAPDTRVTRAGLVEGVSEQDANKVGLSCTPVRPIMCAVPSYTNGRRRQDNVIAQKLRSRTCCHQDRPFSS